MEGEWDGIMGWSRFKVACHCLRFLRFFGNGKEAAPCRREAETVAAWNASKSPEIGLQNYSRPCTNQISLFQMISSNYALWGEMGVLLFELCWFSKKR